MADLPLLAAQLLGRPHLVTPAYAEVISSVLAGRIGIQASVAEDDMKVHYRSSRHASLTSAGVYVLPIVGGLYHRSGNANAPSGAHTYVDVQNHLVTALNTPEVKGIMLDIDSPGGQGAGCFELGDIILSARKSKPIWAVANSLAASAAYAIGSAATKLYCTPSGEVGSVGVVYMHADMSKAMEAAGVAVTYIYAGKHKIDGNPYQPLPASVKAEIQSGIDEMYEGFVAHVAKARGLDEKAVRKTEARCFRAEEAKSLGLVDQIGAFDAALSDFTASLNKTSAYRIGPQGAAMSGTGTAATAPKIEGLSEALAQARSDGMSAARAELEPKLAEAYIQGRKDASTIFTSENAKGRSAAAAVFAGNPKFSAEEAIAMLGTVAKEAADPRAEMAAEAPKVVADAGGKPQAASQGDMSDYQKLVNANLGQIFGAKKGQ
jgi:capsid assembly protease